MTVVFYSYTGKKNVIQKKLENGTEKNLVLKNDFSEIGTSILLKEKPDFSFNYIEIPNLKKYYFIDNMTVISNDIIRIDLSEDVLMTFKDEILKSRALIVESENPNVNDMTHSTNKIEETIKYTFPNNPIDYSGSISMACINGSIE